MNTKDIAVDLDELDGFTLSAIIGNRLVQRSYTGDNIKAAKRDFIARNKESK